jgi:hypothetical protein
MVGLVLQQRDMLLGLLLLLLPPLAARAVTAAKKPNFVLFLQDDQDFLEG